MVNVASAKQSGTSQSARFNEILGTLVHYGMADWVKDPFPDFIKDRFKTSDGADVRELTPGVRARLALTELGPTFIKLGQIASTRIDLVGPEMAEELEKLQADTPADPPEVVLATIEAELGTPASECFAEFNASAIASASIGQAHMATLVDGQEVVVKVQHAGILDNIVADLDILARLARMAEQYDEGLRCYQPQATVAEFRHSLLQELDYGVEKSSMQRISENFADEPLIHIPAVYTDHCSERVLTMERLDGYSIANTDRMKEEGVDGKALLNLAANAFLDMVFRDRFYHADPHPGNLWVLAPGDVLGILDFGMVGRLDSGTQQNIQELILALLSSDAEFLTEGVMNLGRVPRDLDRAALQADIERFVGEYLQATGSSSGAGQWLDNLTGIIRKHHIVLPSGVSQLIRLMIMLEGTVRMLDPDFSLMGLLAERKEQFAEEALSGQKLSQLVMRSYRDWGKLAKILPGALASMASRARDGRYETQVEVLRLGYLVNRSVQGGLSAALLISSALLLSEETPPLIGDLSAMGLLGLLGGLSLGWQVLKAIKKSGGLYEDKY
jgi:ubiquinone biosynthesis protein